MRAPFCCGPLVRAIDFGKDLTTWDVRKSHIKASLILAMRLKQQKQLPRATAYPSINPNISGELETELPACQRFMPSAKQAH